MTAGAAEQAAANSLQEGWKHFDLAERAARFGYWRLALSDNTMFWSPGLYRLLGVSADRTPPDLDWLLEQIDSDDVAVLHQKLESAIADRAPFRFRARTRSRSASARIIDMDAEIEADSRGEVVALVGVGTDVTAQVIAEVEREMAQERFRVMAEEFSDIIVLYENLRAVCASHALTRILGLQPHQLEGGHYLEVVHPDDVGEAGKLRGRPRPGEIWTATYRAKHASGHYVWIEAATRGVPAAAGVTREITVARDVTDRKEQEMRMRAAQERAEAANRAKSLFLANMSHELRTPLNAIIGFADMMRQQVFGALGDARYNDYATRIHESGRDLLNRLSDVLEMSRIEGGILELRPENFDLSEILRGCAMQARESARKRKLHLEVSLPPSPMPVVADRNAVTQILHHLISNAVKFTRPNGHIAVEARFAKDEVVIDIRDDGVGIPAGALARIGRPFEQACAEPYLAKGGQGLGLALVHALAEKHGGVVAIDSVEGKGTSVSVKLPTRLPRAAA